MTNEAGLRKSRHKSRRNPHQIRDRFCSRPAIAYHLICPRPLVHAVQQSGIRFSVEVLGNMTGCYERCLQGMRHTPGVNVPAEPNKKVKEQFSEYISNYLDYQTFVREDESATADFGTFMDEYRE